MRVRVSLTRDDQVIAQRVLDVTSAGFTALPIGAIVWLQGLDDCLPLRYSDQLKHELLAQEDPHWGDLFGIDPDWE